MVSSWQLVAERVFTPDDLDEVIGVFNLDEGHDTLWIRVTQLNAGPVTPWAYGILSWQSADGRELGSVKAYGHNNSEVFRLGVGLPPRVRGGSITFTPRAFNLGWIKEGFPWSLRFEAVSGSSAIAVPDDGNRATVMVPAVPEGNALPSYEILDGLAWLFFNIFAR